MGLWVDRYTPKRISKESAIYKSPRGVGKYTSYYKISTPHEVATSHETLNSNNDWIQLNIKKSVSGLAEGYNLLVEQSNYLIVQMINGSKIPVGKASVTNAGEPVLREIFFYDKKEHGKITRQIAVFKKCLVTEGAQQGKRKVAIVLSEDSPNPHIKIIE